LRDNVRIEWVREEAERENGRTLEFVRRKWGTKKGKKKGKGSIWTL